MSNKRNPRRKRQRTRSEIERKPKKLTKAMGAFIQAQPAERARKTQARRNKSKEERRRVERLVRRWRITKPRKQRKPRTNIKRWIPSHDLDN